MKRSLIAVLTAGTVLLAMPGIASAAGPAVGTATSSISIFTLDASRKAVGLGAGTGFASTDQVKQNLGALNGKASMSFIAARLLDVLSTPELAVETTSDKSSDSEVDTTSPLLDLASASGTLTIAGMRADVDNAIPSAKSTLGQVTLDADLIDSMVSLQGIKIALVNESNPTEAKSLLGIQIANVFVLPLREIIDRSTNLSAEDIISLAAGFGGDATSDELGEVNAQKASFLSTLEGIAPGLIDTSFTVDLMISCGSPLTTLICDLPTVASARASLQTAVATLKAAVGALPLLNLKNVVVGITASAGDTSSASSAGLSWGSVQVAGIEVPVTAEDIQASVASVSATLTQLVTLMKNLTGLGGLTLKVTPPEFLPTKGQSGDYYTAASSITPFMIDVTLPAAPGVSSELNVGGQLFKVAGNAEHRPRVLGAPPLSNGPPPLANTGANVSWMLVGLLMIVAANRLRRWLGDAA